MHDSAYKLLFSRPRMVRDLLDGFAARGWGAALDFDTLTPLPANFVSEDLARAAPRRPRVANPVPRRPLALPRAAPRVPGRRRPRDGGAHAGVHGSALPADDRRRRAQRARDPAAGAAGRPLQRPASVDGAGRDDGPSGDGKRDAGTVPAVAAILSSGRGAGGRRRPAGEQSGVGADRSGKDARRGGSGRGAARPERPSSGGGGRRVDAGVHGVAAPGAADRGTAAGGRPGAAGAVAGGADDAGRDRAGMDPRVARAGSGAGYRAGHQAEPQGRAGLAAVSRRGSSMPPPRRRWPRPSPASPTRTASRGSATGSSSAPRRRSRSRASAATARRAGDGTAGPERWRARSGHARRDASFRIQSASTAAPTR